jgi:hypothetical protein
MKRFSALVAAKYADADERRKTVFWRYFLARTAENADILIAVPETETYKAQELHLPVYHALCAMLEEEFYGG